MGAAAVWELSLGNFGNSTDDRFDSDLKESYTKQGKRQNRLQRLCNVMRGLVAASLINGFGMTLTFL
jgi:hypothetical protein